MSGKIESGQLCTVVPVRGEHLNDGDIGRVEFEAMCEFRKTVTASNFPRSLIGNWNCASIVVGMVLKFPNH